MSLYPSLEDMNVDSMARAQMSHQTTPYHAPSAPAVYGNGPGPSRAPSAPVVYPALADFMGLELSPSVIARNMPEYQMKMVQARPTPTTGGMVVVAPLSSQSPSLAKAMVTQAIRAVTLCKDRDGKVGLRLHAVSGGVFVCVVVAGSPAALAGLRFGDQVLEIDGVAVAGMSMDRCHDMLRRAPVNGIQLAVRDRPFERTITLHKDSTGHLGFQFKEGRIVSLVAGSSAARNGVLTDHQLLEVNAVTVVGLTDKQIAKVIAESPDIVNITVIPLYIYKHMISKMSSALLRQLDRSPAV